MIKRRTSKGRGVEMANIAILSGRYVGRQYTHAGNVVVARCAVENARARVKDDTGMIIEASAESARGMAVATILIISRTRKIRIGWHVRIESRGKWFACGSNLQRWYRAVIAMAGLAVDRDTRMIKDCVSKILSVMTRAAIFGSILMTWSIRCRCGINTSASIVAGFTRLLRCIQQGVVENTAGHFES